jgi:hypothetical protein
MSHAAREQGLLDGRSNVSDSMIMSDLDSQMSFTDSDVSRFQNKLDGHQFTDPLMPNPQRVWGTIFIPDSKPESMKDTDRLFART